MNYEIYYKIFNQYSDGSYILRWEMIKILIVLKMRIFNT